MATAQIEKVEFGLSNCHLGDCTYQEGTGYTFGAPKAYLGIQGLVADPKMEEKVVYADNGVWYVAQKDDGYDITLKMARMEEEFMVNYLGMRKTKEGNLVESADDYKRKKDFYIVTEVDTDLKPNRYVFFRVQASKPKSDFATNENSVDPKSYEIPCKAYPLLGEVKSIKAKIRPEDANYATIITSGPKLPDFQVAV